MDVKLALSIASALVAVLFGFAPYLRDTLHRKTQPHAYTWLIWSITQGTAAAGLLSGNGGWAVLLLWVGAATVFTIFLLSFRFGTRNITRSDTYVLTAALLAIVGWWWLNNPLLAVLVVTAIDLLGYVPSIRKVYTEPWSETLSAWSAFIVANLLAIVALNAYNFLTLTYLIAISIGNVALVAVCLVRRRRVSSPMPVRS